jgi:hypothetical protein
MHLYLENKTITLEMRKDVGIEIIGRKRRKFRKKIE